MSTKTQTGISTRETLGALALALGFFGMFFVGTIVQYTVGGRAGIVTMLVWGATFTAAGSYLIAFKPKRGERG